MINDFGQKIGGAKKDLWKDRGLTVEDLLVMNEAEKNKYINKDNIWKKPNYQAIVDSGVSVRVVYFMKLLRDATPTKPIFTYKDNSPEKIQQKQDNYIEFVRTLMESSMNLKTESEVLNFFDNHFKKYLYKEADNDRWKAVEKFSSYINNKLSKVVNINNFLAIDREIKRKQFCYSVSEKEAVKKKQFKNLFDLIVYDKNNLTIDNDQNGRVRWQIKTSLGRYYFYPTGENADPSTYTDRKILILYQGKLIAKNLDQDSANKMLNELFRNNLEKNTAERKKRKTNFIPKQLSDIKRTGDDFRNGSQVKGFDYLQIFEFKGGEFGNWLSEKDRQSSLNFGFDALLDLCNALNIECKDISLGNRLSLAFGARGQGAALAHYEPLREVINLTKMKGAGSLAHEWAHALDDILGKKLGINGYMSGKTYKKEVLDSMKKLMETIKHKEVFNSEIEQAQQQEVSKYMNQIEQYINSFFLNSSMNKEQIKCKEKLISAYFKNANNCKDIFYPSVISGIGNKDIDNLSNFHKEVTGRVLNKELRIQLINFQNNLRMKIEQIGKPQKINTDFYNNSILFDSQYSKSDHGYWQSNEEMFARSFACYVLDKLEYKSDYLCGHADMAIGLIGNFKTNKMEIVRAFPVGEERKNINNCFDQLFKELKEKNLLHERNRSQIKINCIEDLNYLVKKERKDIFCRKDIHTRNFIEKSYNIIKNESIKAYEMDIADGFNSPELSEILYQNISKFKYKDYGLYEGFMHFYISEYGNKLKNKIETKEHYDTLFDYDNSIDSENYFNQEIKNYYLQLDFTKLKFSCTNNIQKENEISFSLN